MLEHAHKITQGYGPATVVDYLASVRLEEQGGEEPMLILGQDMADDFPLVDVVKVEIPSMGLW